MNADDFYVEVLEAADAWFDLTEQDAEPTDSEWDSAHEKLEDAVGALREYETKAGSNARTAAWGGRQIDTFAVIDAADAWYSQGHQDQEPPQAQQDATLDRLGAAIQALRHAPTP